MVRRAPSPLPVGVYTILRSHPPANKLYIASSTTQAELTYGEWSETAQTSKCCWTALVTVALFPTGRPMAAGLLLPARRRGQPARRVARPACGFTILPPGKRRNFMPIRSYWSPDGRRLAAWDGSVGSIRVVELATGDMMLLKTQSGMVGTWSPDGGTMLFNELSFVSEQTYVKMYSADFATKQVNLAFETGQELVDYSVPIWSPDGLWIAAGIKTPTSGLGSQLWVMHPDGSEARPIADEIEYTYGAYRWNSWSDGLIFQRFALGVPFAKPDILLWLVADNSVRVFASDASKPAWLP